MGAKIDLAFSYLIKGCTRPKRVLQVLKNSILDFVFGGKYLGVTLANEDKQRGYVNTGSSEYTWLEQLFSHVSINNDDVIVDVGCGKGRVLNWLLSKRLKNKLIGVEVYPEIASFTRDRLKKYTQVEIITGCVGEDERLIEEGTIFYLYHPFRERLMKNFSDQLANKIKVGCYPGGNRPVIIYHNHVYLDVFEQNSTWKIKRIGKIGEHESAIIYPA